MGIIVGDKNNIMSDLITLLNTHILLICVSNVISILEKQIHIASVCEDA